MGSGERRSEAAGPLVGLLLLAYVFNFLDRQLLAILRIPIKAELHLTDTQLGLMGGLSFASVYFTLANPACQDRRPVGPGAGRRRLRRGIESVHCFLRHGAEFCSAVHVADGGRRRRGRRGCAKLCVDCR